MAAEASSSPFARGSVLLMVAIGFVAFLALLYAIGAGGALRPGNNGQAHGASSSIVGYSALGQLLEKTGTPVRYGRSPVAAQQQDLLIVTPELYADPQELAALVSQRAYTGPTIIILPKWQVTPIKGFNAGWVQLESPWVAAQAPQVLSRLVTVSTRIEGVTEKVAQAPFIQAQTPEQKTAMLRQAIRARVTISGDKLKTVLADPETGAARVAVIDDGGWYPSLDRDAPAEAPRTSDTLQGRYPVVIVADADLMNNLGLANRKTAAQALQIVDAAWSGGGEGVVFDLTQNGLGASENLLSVAFRPPFVGAVASLVLAAIAFARMAFFRFGPPVADERPFGFGKTALVKGSAALVRRLGRERVVAQAYADLLRDRAARALGLPPALPPDQVDARLALVPDDSAGNSYETLVANLRSARDRPALSAAARALYRWKKERMG
ncbi:hypothetical protein C7451_10766 [Blastomonas natatoria]|uniref:DUF4350 domain-containing protein n=1 Tax=Blastomonas natatoria TaxID=34015 RepID=A0A2V3V093_9SPHN|nr:DUF4350 domain-containing protein [Blastomonas natatoria]PXW75097.1 hypothetical protein C7451_10766 [Blastomonas natatoria]